MSDTVSKVKSLISGAALYAKNNPIKAAIILSFTLGFILGILI